jgi:hypothetical protein
LASGEAGVYRNGMTEKSIILTHEDVQMVRTLAQAARDGVIGDGTMKLSIALRSLGDRIESLLLSEQERK